MLANFVNPLMLLGLLGLALPVLAHLLSKKKFDIVEWGAMQFLELGRNARRKIRLEQLLLMALRMGLILLIVLAFARPWTQGSFFSKILSKQNRDIVLIIDGSYSMGWRETSTTPHAAAIQFAQKLLPDLRPGDTIALIDARDQPRLVIETPVSDFGRVRRELNEIPPPAGSSNLAEAMHTAVQILSTTDSLSREIIVITDGQAKGWQPDDEGLWTLYDKMLDEPSAKPRTWVVEVGPKNSTKRTNFAVENLQLSREVTAVGYPVRISTKLRLTSGKQTSPRKVFFEVDGQRLAEMTKPIMIPAKSEDGEQSIDFEYTFTTAGSHLISVIVEKDNLPGDNRADAAVTVTDAVPVLLVDGDPRPGKPRIESETAFAVSALTPGRDINPAPWVSAEVVPWNNLDSKIKDLAKYEAIFLANVPRFTDAQIKALTEYLDDGGGLFFALGDKIDAAHYKSKLYNKGKGILPASPVQIEKNDDDTKKIVRAAPESIDVPWMITLKHDPKIGFLSARYTHYWKTTVAPQAAAKKANRRAGKTEEANGAADVSDATVIARLNTGDPLMVSRKQGRGHTMLMTSSLDKNWGTLQGTADYTPFLHEAVFFLASSKASRNVPVGVPLLLRVPETDDISDHVFFGPGKTTFPPAEGLTVNGKKLLRLNDTSLPGIYQFRKKNEKGERDPTSKPEYFVVNFDRGESDLTPLSDENRTALKDNGEIDGDRMEFHRTHDALTESMFRDNSAAEFWHWLLLTFLGILVFEVVMTRRMVQGGHFVGEDESENSASSPPPLPPGRSSDFLEEAEFVPAK